MISANELRIGNWFQLNDGTKHKWSEESWKEIFKGFWSFDMLQPIPLTLEILEKCGFRKDSHAYVIPTEDSDKEFLYNKYDFGINFSDGKFYITNGNAYDEYKVGINIQHLHQLQNVFFALTGQELLINL